MTRTWNGAVLGVLLVTAGACGGDDGDAPCTGDGTIDLGPLCLRDVSVESRGESAWGEAAALTVEPAGANAVILTVTAAGPSRGLALHVPGLAADRMLQQGLQSWSFTGTVLIPAAVPLDPDGLPEMQEASTGDPFHASLGDSMHAALFRQGTTGPVLVIGALSAERATTGIAAIRGDDERAAVTVLYGPQRELLPAGPGGAVQSERLFVAAAATPEEGLARLGAAVRAAHPDVAPKQPPAGWYSWNEHFEDIDAALIDANAAAVAASLAPHGMTLVEIDDGWERAWGDWQADPTRFPAGMGPVVQGIMGRGLTAGVWLAPFLVDVDSEAAATADPSLFVRGPDGQPIRHQISGNPRTFYILDGTNPDSMAMVTAPMAELAAAGVTYFKLDFLYAGQIAGQRAQAVTGAQALRAGMLAIREAIGPDAVINACGAPVLQMIGVADSLRIGPDTAFSGFALTWTLVAAAARNLAARSYLGDVIWLDADQVQVRAPYTADEAEAGALVTALAGPAYSIGDDLTTLPAERLAIATSADVLALAAAGGRLRPIGLMDAATDEIGVSPLLEWARFDSGMAVAPPARFEVLDDGGAVLHRLDVDWLGSHRATLTPGP
jgi:hypothetical protein